MKGKEKKRPVHIVKTHCPHIWILARSFSKHPLKHPYTFPLMNRTKKLPGRNFTPEREKKYHKNENQLKQCGVVVVHRRKKWREKKNENTLFRKNM